MTRRFPGSVPLDLDPMYPGDGYPPRPGEDRPGLSPFGRLAKGQPLGKSSILIYDNESNEVQPSPVPILAVEGDDLDAGQMVVTLHPPRVIPLSFNEVRSRLDQQNVTGEQTNSEVTDGDFPGTDKPMRWPPLEATVEFGVGGVNTKIVVDYVNGVTLNVIASYVRVHALVTQGRRNGEIFGTSAAYYLAAHIGPGFAESHVQRTVFVGDVEDQHESDVFDVPKFAKVALLVGSRRHEHHHRHRHQPPTLTVGWIRFWQSPDGTNPVGDFFASNLERIEVPNGGLYFSVFNQSGHTMKMSSIFELAL